MKEDQIIEIIADVLEMDIQILNSNSTREKIESWDSLSHVQIIAELEERLNIKIPFDEIANIEKISDFFVYI